MTATAYAVQTREFGVIFKREDSIAAARAWAARAFPGEPVSVHRWTAAKLCDRCESRPCLCRHRKGAVR